MTLVDTSVWIDHFRSGNQRLSALLETGQVLTHDWLSRERTFALLDRLPKATAATDLDLRANSGGEASWMLDARLRRMAAGLGIPGTWGQTGRSPVF